MLLCGRKYKGDVYEGVKVSDFLEDTLEGREVLIMNCRILKKWKRRTDEPRIIRTDVIMDMKDLPFITYVLSWLAHQKRLRENVRYMPVSRSRVYQILKQVDSRIVGPHWFRHQRLSHLAESLNPYKLTEQIGFWERA